MTLKYTNPSVLRNQSTASKFLDVDPLVSEVEMEEKQLISSMADENDQ